MAKIIQIKKLFLLLLILCNINITAQSLNDLSFGSADNLDIITWNLEWFPKNGQATLDSLTTAITALDVDIIAVQEISDTTEFNNLISQLSEYGGYYTGSNLRLGFIYKTSLLINSIATIFSNQSYNFANRPPLLMDVTFNNENFIIINTHFKCCGDGVLDLSNVSDEETRRYNAMSMIQQYIDQTHSNSNAIVLGDFNDLLTDVSSNNVFQQIINDSTNYMFVDMTIANGSLANWSYPSWPSHLDHILITNELFDELNNGAIETILIDNYFSGGFLQYDAIISDHRPVGLSLGFPIYGCTDSSAINYTSNANTDDGSCCGLQLDWQQIGQDIDGEASYDASGRAISFDSTGSIVAIGARWNDGAGIDAGHVRVYHDNGSAWIQLGQDIDGEHANDFSGHSLAINGAGNRVAIGAYGNDDNGTDAGHVRVYQDNGSAWIQLGQDIDGELANDFKGFKVDINEIGDRIVVGSYGNDGNGTNAGKTQVYHFDGVAWNQVGSNIYGTNSNDVSSKALQINDVGDIIAIGSPSNADNGANSGQVRVFEFLTTDWVQIGQNLNGESNGDFSGGAISLNDLGNIIAIGAKRNDGSGSNAGHVRVFQYSANSWIQIGQDIDGESVGDESGYSLSLNGLGNKIAIGSYLNSDNATESGHARVFYFDANTNTWNQIGNDVDGEFPNDWSGRSVALNHIGDKLAVGADLNDGNGNHSGHVRIFNYNTSCLIDGCTDSLATNYNPLAMIDDGSCIYSPCGNRYQSEIFSNVAVSTVNYSDVYNDTYHQMDIYTPNGDTNTDRPVVIYMHGGSYYLGNKNLADCVDFCTSFAKRGYVAISMNYRLANLFLFLSSHEEQYKAILRTIADVKSATRYLRKNYANGNSLGIDANAIFIGGYSAGAITAIHSAFVDTITDLQTSPINVQNLVYTTIGSLEGDAGNLGYSSSVQGVFSFAGGINNLDWIDSTDEPIVSAHGAADITVNYNCGSMFNLSSTLSLCGAGEIHPKADSVGIINSVLVFPSDGHLIFANGNGNAKFIQAVGFTSDFLYQLIPCNQIYGCTDSIALNYNPLATINDGSCTYCVYGCTDSLATNYYSGATCDDGSCTYSNTCGLPTNLHHTDLIHDRVTLNWNSTNSATCEVDQIRIKYREVGTTTWSQKNMGAPTGSSPGPSCNISNSDKLVLNLTPGTQYEWYMKAWYCNAATTNWTALEYFTTLDECPNITNFTATPLSNTKVRFDWTLNGTYNFVRIKLREDYSGTLWFNAGGFGISYPAITKNKNGLNAGTSYRAVARTWCDPSGGAYRAITWTAPVLWTQPTAVRIANPNLFEQTLIRITDILGREINPHTAIDKTILFYIYDDGIVEKRIIIE